MSLFKKNLSSKAGFSTLVLVFYLMFIFVSLAGAMTTVVLVSKRQYATNLGARKAYYGAESYINRELFKMMVNDTYWPASGSYVGGSVVIEADDEGFIISHITSGAKRTLEVSKEVLEVPEIAALNILMLLDCTGSMEHESRMSNAKGAIASNDDSFLKSLKANKDFQTDGKLGFWTYTIYPKSYTGGTLAEPTDDIIDNLVNQISDFDNNVSEDKECRVSLECQVSLGRSCDHETNTGGAAGEAAKFMKNYDGKKAIVLVTDGGPNQGILNNIAPGQCEYPCSESDYDKCDEDNAVPLIECVARTIKDWEDLRIYVVLIAEKEKDIDENHLNALKKLATSDGKYDGGYYFSANASNLNDVLTEIQEEMLIYETFHLREVKPEAD